MSVRGRHVVVKSLSSEFLVTKFTFLPPQIKSMHPSGEKSIFCEFPKISRAKTKTILAQLEKGYA